MCSNAPRFALSNSLVLISTRTQFLSFICLVDIKVTAVTTIPVAFYCVQGSKLSLGKIFCKKKEGRSLFPTYFHFLKNFSLLIQTLTATRSILSFLKMLCWYLKDCWEGFFCLFSSVTDFIVENVVPPLSLLQNKIATDGLPQKTVDSLFPVGIFTQETLWKEQCDLVWH